jgi:hypothetical protein
MRVKEGRCERRMKIYIPREHGAWSIWFTPFMIATFLSPWTELKMVAFIGVLSLYISSAPLLAFVRSKRVKESPLPSLFFFSFFGFLFIGYLVWHFPELVLYGVLVSPLLMINLYFAKKKKERLFLNDLSAIIALSSVSMFIVHVGYGYFHWSGVKIWLLSVVYFIGTVFYVKSFIREKGNRLFKKQGYVYHSLIVLLPMLFGFWWISAIFLPSSLKYWLTPPKMKIRPIVIGIVEIVGSVVFVGLNVLLFK